MPPVSTATLILRMLMRPWSFLRCLLPCGTCSWTNPELLERVRLVFFHGHHKGGAAGLQVQGVAAQRVRGIDADALPFHVPGILEQRFQSGALRSFSRRHQPCRWRYRSRGPMLRSGARGPRHRCWLPGLPCRSSVDVQRQEHESPNFRVLFRTFLGDFTNAAGPSCSSARLVEEPFGGPNCR
jgi:hypothetical protein